MLHKTSRNENPKGDVKMKKNLLVLVTLMLFYGIMYAVENPTEPDILINPNPMERSTTIGITFYEGVKVSVVIETLTGVAVKNLFYGDLASGTYEFHWTRLDNNGLFVPKGTYNLTIYYDTRYTSTKKTLILK